MNTSDNYDGVWCSDVKRIVSQLGWDILTGNTKTSAKWLKIDLYMLPENFLFHSQNTIYH
jgi:hypothetical protein